MSDDWPQTAVDYVQAIADTKLVLSHRYAEWMLSGPALEDDIAGASATQDEIGQVRQLFRLLEQQGRDSQWLEKHRQPREYANAATLDHPADTWAEFVVQVALTDRATWLLLDAIDHDDFTGLVEKIGEDEYFHLEYHDGRLEALAADEPTELQHALEDFLPRSLAFIGPRTYDEEGDPLVQAGFTDRPVADIREAFLDHYEALFEGTDVSLTNIDRSTPAVDDWNESRRRPDDGTIDESVVESLQGVRNKEFAIE